MTRTLQIFCLAMLLSLPVLPAANEPSFELTIRDHRFTPEELSVPAGQKIKLVVKNEDATPEEFESKALNREKVIAGNGQGTIYVGPLKSGEYHFVGEYHEATAKGKLIVR